MDSSESLAWSRTGDRERAGEEGGAAGGGPGQSGCVRKHTRVVQESQRRQSGQSVQSPPERARSVLSSGKENTLCLQARIRLSLARDASEGPGSEDGAPCPGAGGTLSLLRAETPAACILGALRSSTSAPPPTLLLLFCF